MTSAFDQRIVRLTLELEDGVHSYEQLAIRAHGMKLASAMQSQCEVMIYNLTKEHRNYIITQASPFVLNRKPIRMNLEVGRESYGTFSLFQGDVLFGGVTQPPDIGVALTSLNNGLFAGIMFTQSHPQTMELKTICQSLADRNKLALDFQATPKKIENYVFNGSLTRELNALQRVGNVVAFIDGGKIVVLDSNKPKKSNSVRLINASTGMVGVPQPFERGIIVKMMIDNSIELGAEVEIESEINPAANGKYMVQQINFDVSNRDNPFWYTIQCLAQHYNNTVLQ
jgi:hypothetical protein